MIRLLVAAAVGGSLAVTVGFVFGCWWLAAHPADDTCHNCEHVVGRLEAELAKETRERRRHEFAADYFARVAATQRSHIDWQADLIDQLEHEQATDGGASLVAETERYLADPERGS